ncbi:hypothetical protein [Actinokineospora sp.]|uniref:hypothetical protein n=1 Tax=Actinokineospora sp. TaxID=1872133 RepID=UPI0040382C2B
MNEQDLRHALRGAMSTAEPPPSMNGSEMLDTAQRALRRRRAAWAGAGTAAAVAVITAGAVVLPGLTGGSPQVGVAAGGITTTRPVQTTPPPPSTDPSSTKTSWPDGQTDRTASQGPRHAKGLELLDLLTASAPEGFETPTDLKPANPEFAGELRGHQAQFADEVGGKQIWEYQAAMPLGFADKWGKLMVEVHIAGNKDEGESCALIKSFWGVGGECQLFDVDGKQVGVITKPDDDRFDQWAAYRHPDGTTVAVAQSKAYWMTDLPGLAEQPLTVAQLARLAAESKFALS